MWMERTGSPANSLNLRVGALPSRQYMFLSVSSRHELANEVGICRGAGGIIVEIAHSLVTRGGDGD